MGDARGAAGEVMTTHAFVAIHQPVTPGPAALAALFVPPGPIGHEGVLLVARMAAGLTGDGKTTTGAAMIEAIDGALRTFEKKGAQGGQVWCSSEMIVSSWNRWQRGEQSPPTNAAPAVATARALRVRVVYLLPVVDSARMAQAERTAIACFEKWSKGRAPTGPASPAAQAAGGFKALRADVSNKKGRE